MDMTICCLFLSNCAIFQKYTELSENLPLFDQLFRKPQEILLDNGIKTIKKTFLTVCVTEIFGNVAIR